MKYILLVHELSEIGGGQLYVLRKAFFLKSQGYEVRIVTGRKEPLRLKELDHYPVLTQTELLYEHQLYSYRALSKIFDGMQSFISSRFVEDPCLLEATSVRFGLFADNVAKKLGVRYFVYDISGAPLRKREQAKFAAFKLSRGELLGCSKYSNQKLFANFPEYYDESKNLYVNVPFDNSEIVDDTKGTEFSKDPNTLRILTVSRIEKRYLAYLIGEVSKVAQIIPDKTIELTMVLSRRHGKEFDLLKKQSLDIPKNMKVSFLGPIVPLTKSLFLTHDIFVGVGTASLNAISLGVPTIVADFNSDKSIGILGIDAEDFGYAPIKDITISQQIQRFLDNPTLFMEASERGLSLFQEEYESSAVMTKFMEHVERIMKQEPEYYSFDKISLSGREKLKKAVMSIAGVKGYDFLVKLYAKRRGYSE